MRPGWNLRRQSARLWKSTVRSCQARCAAPHASPAPSAGTWTPGAAPALLTPGRSNAAASAGSSTSAAWEAAGSSTRGRGRAACDSALPLGATRRPEPPGAAAALRRRSSRPEEAQQPPSGTEQPPSGTEQPPSGTEQPPRYGQGGASDHAAVPATARLATQPRPKSVSHARLSSPA
jgi:hypothetical protein